MKKKQCVIVGAGPTGLFLGNILQGAGIDVTILEQRNTLSTYTKGIMLHAKALELLEKIGVIESILNNCRRLDVLSFYLLHQSLRFSFSFRELPTKYPFYAILPQPTLEKILLKQFKYRGGKVIFNAEFDQLIDNCDNYVRISYKYNKETKVLVLTDFLFGCDGALSKVRNSISVEFFGNGLDLRYILAEGMPYENLPSHEASMYITCNGLLSVIPLPNGKFRVAGPGTYENHQPGSINNHYFEAILDKMSLKQKLGFISYSSVKDYAVSERIAKKFSINRIALLGDAAHIHSPAGGQSITTGFQDAWSLCKRILQEKLEFIPKSYHEERHYHAKEIIKLTNFSNFINFIRNVKTEKDISTINLYGNQLVKKLSQLDEYRGLILGDLNGN